MKLSVVLAVLLGTLVVACSSATPTPNIDATIEARVGQILTKIPTETPIPTLTPVPPATAPASTSEEGLAPNFSFNLYQGEDILGSETKQLSQLRGTPVVLNFWARLCPPCWTEMPELQEFSEEFQGQIILLGIDIGQFTGLGPPRDASKLLDSMGITYPAGFTDDGDVVEQYKVLAVPTTVFIDGQGRIFQKWTGALDRGTVTLGGAGGTVRAIISKRADIATWARA